MSMVMKEEIKRWTAKRKSALVIEILQGKTTVSEAKLSAVERLTDSRFWALTAANSTAYGALAAANGGQFGPAFGSGVMSSLGANLNALVGDWAYQNNIAEGSLSKIALHAGIGALQAGATRQDALAGAIGGATAEALSRFNNQLDQLTGNKAASELTTAGASIIANQLLNKNPNTTHLTAATLALQTDRNNRQLHPSEKQRIKELANGDTKKEARLTAAACAMVRCYAEYPEGSVTYNTLKAMADAGNSDAMAAERLQLQAQKGMFNYSTQGLLSDVNIDAAKQFNNTYQVTTRAVGAGQAVLGGLGIAGSVATTPISCATGVGCVASAVVGTLSADQAFAGAKQAVSGKPENTYLNEALQGLGLSSEAASYAEFALSMGAAAKAGNMVNAVTATQAANSAAARLSYEDIAKFGAKGLNVTPEVMQTPQAKALIAEYRATGVDIRDATDYAFGVLQTGNTLPTVRTVAANEALIKVVPKSAMADDGVSKFSPYFMTRSEYDSLSKLSPAEIGQRLGLPAEQNIRGAQLGFEAYSITPKPGTAPKVFTSTVAPVEQGAYKAIGGAEQTIVPNRSQWTEPKRIGSIGGAK